MSLLDFREPTEFAWSADLEPVGEGTFDKEPFSAWWSRNAPGLSHLHPKICEQWIHRHWNHSPWSFLELHRLNWSKQRFETADLLSRLHREFAGPLNVDFDFKVFQGRDGDKLPTARALDEGTWDFPIVVLDAPSGLVTFSGEPIGPCMALIEGHQRHRYLNALFHMGVTNGPHDVFILTTDQFDT